MNLGLKLDLADIALVPEPTSRFNSRKEIKPTIDGWTLPLINAPMYSVINSKSFTDFADILAKNRVKVCISRGLDKPWFDNYWKSISLEDTYNLEKTKNTKFHQYILIDVANGHMQRILDTVSMLKSEFGNDITLMVGNIAHPETFKKLSEAGADYIRVGIGGGAVCITSTQSAVHYPQASLISECYDLKKQHQLGAKIVADGGIGSYSDVVKCLALGADLVMMGKVFASALESDNAPYLWKYIKINNYKFASWLFDMGLPLYKKHYGMSTKEAQQQMGNKVLKTSEGTTRWYKVEYRLKTWIENFEDYLRSAMSYSNSENLEEFKDSIFVQLTNSTINKINK
jgi:GMP reductase